MLETSQMQRLVAVAEYGTISEAAEGLYITQPALSRSLKKMEEELGVELFDRSKKNEFKLTPTGEAAVEQSREILLQIENMTRQLRDAGQFSATMTIGSCTPPALWELLPILADKFINAHFATIINTTPVLEKALAKGEIQIAFLNEPLELPSFECLDWGVERLFAIFPENHPLSNRESVLFEDLGEQAFLIQEHVGDWLEVAKQYAPSVRLLRQEDRLTLLGLAREASLPRFMSNMTMQFSNLLPGEKPVPVTGEGSQMHLWCVFSRDLPSEFAAFLQERAHMRTRVSD